MKRWLILLCALFSLYSPQSLLAATAALTIGTVQGTAGQSASVPVSINNGGAQVGGLQLQIAFDPTKYSALPTVTKGAAATVSGIAFSSNVSAAGTITILAYADGSVDGAVIANGTVASLSFPVKSDAVGTLPITFGTAPLVSDPLGAAVSVTATNGAITVSDTAAPTVSAFTIPATSTSRTITNIGITATDNLAVTAYNVSESATVPTTGWSTTVPTQYNVTASLSTGVAKSVTLYGWAKDAAGNAAYKTAAVTITLPDTTAPTVTGVTIPSTSTTLQVAVSGFTATDTVGVTGYLLTETSSTPALTDTAWKSTGSAWTSFTFSSGGAKTLYAWAKDAAGNISTPLTRNITITLPDAEAPVVSAFTVPATSITTVIPVSTFTATDNKAVTGYLVTQSSTKPTAATAGWTTTAPTSYTVTGTISQGVTTNVTLYGWAKDAAGNVSAGVSDVVAITLPDTTKPVVGTFTVPATATSATVTVTAFTATDNLAVTGYLVNESATAPAADATGWTANAPTSYTFTGLPQGTSSKTLYAWAKDAAGNVSLSKSASVSITLTGPTLTLTGMLADGATTKNPALTVAGTVTGTSLSGLTVKVNSGAAQNITYDQNGAFSTAATLAEGANTVVVTATDANGQTSVTRNITYNPNAADLAVTTPVSDSFVKSSLVDVTGTVGAPQTTTLTIALNGGTPATVALNGGNSFTYQLTLVKGVNTIVVTATDTVNGPHTQSITVTYDPDAPVLAVTAPADSFATAKSSVTLSGTVTDALTAPAVVVKLDGTNIPTQPVVGTNGSFSATIDLPTVKTYSVTVTATDESGNSSTVTRTVIRKNPSGNLTDGVSAPTITDVQNVLKFALGLATATADQKTNVDVAPLVSGKPAPDGAVDAGDALVILEKITGTVSWQ
nr:cohesin domain-containing protein [Geomonas ferrireducens]